MTDGFITEGTRDETVERPPADGVENGQRAYLSIGEVLDALREEFPDITISKIRFLESQGLLEPERTPSGYRKFYPADLTRLRWVLQQQREKYLPLKVIRASLADAESAGLLPTSSGAGAPASPRVRAGVPAPTGATIGRGSSASDGIADDAGDDFAGDGPDGGDGSEGGEGTHLDAPPRALGEGRHPSMRSRTAPNVGPAAGSAASPSNGTSSNRPAWVTAAPPAVDTQAARPGQPGQTGQSAPPAPPARSASPDAPERSTDPLGSRNPLVGIGTGVSLTLNELATASGLGIDDIRLLEQFGLIIGRHVFAATYYDEDALLAAKATAAFRAFGVEPRHLRMYKTAADREADFFSQIVTPLLRRRRDDARVEAAETLEKLARLGEQLRVVALRQVLRASLDVR